jgi:hypothetical protein
MPKGQNIFRGGKKNLRPSIAIMHLMKIFLLPLKIKSAPDEKKPGHASDSLGYKVFISSDILVKYYGSNT